MTTDELLSEMEAAALRAEAELRYEPLPDDEHEYIVDSFICGLRPRDAGLDAMSDSLASLEMRDRFQS